MMIYGDSSASCIIAIVKPDEEFVNKWAVSQKLDASSFASLCQSEALKQAIQADFVAIHKESKLNPLEAVKALILTPTEWTPDSGLVTPTLKLKRAQMRTHFEADIVAAYKTVGEKVGSSDRKDEKSKSEEKVHPKKTEKKLMNQRRQKINRKKKMKQRKQREKRKLNLKKKKELRRRVKRKSKKKNIKKKRKRKSTRRSLRKN